MERSGVGSAEPADISAAVFAETKYKAELRTMT
jgi:hypothetical protein